MKREALLAGDILLADHIVHGKQILYNGIRWGQFFSGSAHGNRKLIHALMYTKTSGSPAAEDEISEMSGDGAVNGPLYAGNFHVYRTVNQILGHHAAIAARNWGCYSGKIKYDRWKAMRSVFRPADDLQRALSKAHLIAPDIYSRPATLISGCFCSYFVIAAWQAAALELATHNPSCLLHPALGWRASATSVRGLHDYLLRAPQHFLYYGLLIIPK